MYDNDDLGDVARSLHLSFDVCIMCGPECLRTSLSQVVRQTGFGQSYLQFGPQATVGPLGFNNTHSPYNKTRWFRCNIHEEQDQLILTVGAE